jgi:hypothetical protein
MPWPILRISWGSAIQEDRLPELCYEVDFFLLRSLGAIALCCAMTASQPLKLDDDCIVYDLTGLFSDLGLLYYIMIKPQRKWYNCDMDFNVRPLTPQLAQITVTL